MMNNPEITWEFATGYDFFISLHVLHAPEKFALRGAWAKGVRARLPASAKAFFEETSPSLLSALPWVYSLQGTKDSNSVLRSLEQLPARKRFSVLMKTAEIPAPIADILDQIADKGAWTVREREAIYKAGSSFKESEAELDGMLDLWSRSAELGEQALEAFQSYYEVFFEEEEERILPALDKAVERAMDMSAELPFLDLLAELSEGIRFEDDVLNIPEWVMVPSFWISPRILTSRLTPIQNMFVFGGRPPEASIVPGQAVPDALLLALKALADPTRLRILHYLEQNPQTPSDLARRLRLRAPTVIHHLNSLRLAGLVYVTYGKGDRKYAARTSRVDEMYIQLRKYLGVSELGRREEMQGRTPFIA